MRLQEKRTILSGKDAVNLLQSGKLAGRIGGKKFVPNWVTEDPKMFEDLVDATLTLIGDNPNIAGDEAIQYLIKFSKESPEKWSSTIENCPDTIIALAKAFATQWFKSEEWQTKINDLIDAPFDAEELNNLEHDIQDFFSKRQAKKGKAISDSNNLYDTLYDDGTWKLFTPKCFEGDIELASHIEPFTSDKNTYTKTRWCTAAQKSFYDRYTEDGNKLYVIQYWHGGKYRESWQLAFNGAERIEFMDKYDHPDYDDVQNAPDELLEKVVYDNPKESILQGLSLKDLFERMPHDGSVTDAIKAIQYEVVKYDEEGYGLNRAGQIISLAKDLKTTDLEIEVVKTHKWSSDINYFIVNGKKIDKILTLTNFENVRRASISGGVPKAFFKGLENLETVICKECDAIESEAFMNCRNLKKVVLDPAISTIQSRAFENCSSLESINIYNAHVWDGSVFQGCTNLKELTMYDDRCYDSFLDSIRDCLEKLTIGGSVVSDGEFFQFSNLVELEVLSKVDTIEACAFENCENLVSVKFPKDKKVKVEAAAFLDCENLEFVENIENVDGNLKRIFAGCPKLNLQGVAK